MAFNVFEHDLKKQLVFNTMTRIYIYSSLHTSKQDVRAAWFPLIHQPMEWKTTATKSSAVSIFSTQETIPTKARVLSPAPNSWKGISLLQIESGVCSGNNPMAWGVDSCLYKMAARGSLTDSMQIWCGETVPREGMGWEDNLGGLYYHA